MIDQTILLSTLVVALGIYATYQHYVIVNLRAWSKQARYALAMSAAMLSQELREREEDDD